MISLALLSVAQAGVKTVLVSGAIFIAIIALRKCIMEALSND
ncbi:MAG: hypothetical protein ACYTGV_03700 [Planctomycetota bacterium]|jgi:hypothetical protein